MTPYQRVMNRLEAKPVDKIPNTNILMTFAAKYIDVPYAKYATDYRHLVEGNIRCCEDFGIDMVSAISDPCRELHDFGAHIIFPADGVPVCKDYLLKERSDLNKLRIVDPNQGRRMSDRIKAIGLYKQKVGGHYPILGWMEGAFAEAANLRGLTNLLMDIMDAPDFSQELLELCTEQAIEFGTEQIKAGADFIGMGDAAASLIGPAHYKRFALPYEQRIIKAFHHLGAKVKLHICGDISKILDLVRESGADMVDIDWMVDFRKAIAVLGDKISASGNFDPTIMLADQNKVEKAVLECIQASRAHTFVAAGCEIPRDTPVENMKRMDQVIRNSKP